MEGYLPGGFCIAWGVLCLPFLIAGFLSIKKTLNEHRNLITLLAMSGAFIFVISSPEDPFSNRKLFSHDRNRTGRYFVRSIRSLHPGADRSFIPGYPAGSRRPYYYRRQPFSMAIAGPFVSYGIYTLCKKAGVNKRAGIFLAATLGDLFTYCVTALQMALAHHADTTVGGALVKFLAVFAPTQVPLAIIEGIITVLIVMGLETYAKPELKAIGFIKEAK